MKIIDTTVQVSGPSGAATGHNGITGKTGLSLKNAAVTIHSNQDGLKTTLDETDVAADSSLAELGNMEIDGGTIDIVSENGDAISVYRTLYLNPITLQVTTKNAQLPQRMEVIKVSKQVRLFIFRRQPALLQRIQRRPIVHPVYRETVTIR